MTGRDYLDVAEHLMGEPGEGYWRSAVSRAYYATFHVARDLLRECGFLVPKAHVAYNYIFLRLQNAGNSSLALIGRNLDDFRGQRNEADYDFHLVVGQDADGLDGRLADEFIEFFEEIRSDQVALTKVTQAIRDYERDVLKDVTWRDPNSP